MNFLLRVEGPGGELVDAALECDDASTVGEVADLLVERLRLAATDAPTLAVVGRSHRPLARVECIGETGVRSGDTVGLRTEDAGLASRAAADALSSAPAVLVVHGRADGYGARRYPLRLGSNVVGRDPSASVVLTDPGIARRHATIYVRDVVEVDDNASATGTWVGGARIRRRTRVEPLTAWSVGDLVVHVERTGGVGDDRSSLSHIPFNPPPRVAVKYAGKDLTVPAPPSRPQRVPLPVTALAMPVLLLAVLFLSDQELNPVTLAFVILMPMMMIGSFAESWWASRKDHQEAVADHAEDVDETLEAMRRAQVREVERRTAESPGARECDVIARALSVRLWERRPGQADLLELTVGMASTRSRCRLAVEPGGARRPARRLRDLPRQYSRVGPVPIVAPIVGEGSIGVAGATPAADVVRSLVVQAAVLHSPADLAVAAIVGPGSVGQWEWLKWLPHCQPRNVPLDVAPIAGTPDDAVNLIEALDAHIAGIGPSTEVDPAKRILVLFDDADLPVERARLSRILEDGPRAGVHVVWLSSHYGQLPSACGLSLIVDDQGSGSMGEASSGSVVSDIAVDRASVAEAEATALWLCPVVDVSRSSAEDEEPPTEISLPVALEDLSVLDSSRRIVERWAESERASTGLPVVIGHQGRAPLLVDLRRDGPHALVAGTTGSGKSELLQTLLASFATTHSPRRLTFLLVDYKGGAAFKDCRLLPHTVGFVTDLDNHEVHRALISLNAELTHRERLLNRYGAKDLIEMEERGIPETPPSLMIVVDEFAALAKEIPEFVDGVVNVAQRGRSLGLHLLLATQRPAGVITDNIRANTNLRIALRVADVEDSVDVIGTPLAAHLSRNLPGRAVVKVGPGELMAFQSAYVGGRTAPGALSSRLDLHAFGLVGSAALGDDLTHGTVGGGPAGGAIAQGMTLAPGQLVPSPVLEAADTPSETDLERIVATTNEATELLGLDAPRKPWLDPLPDLVDVLDEDAFDAGARSPDAGRILVGRVDDPASQAQHDAYLDVARDGNVLVFGASRSGKTSLLRTIAVSVGRNRAGEPVQVYGLDFTGRGLAVLEALPHVGSVIAGDDDERVVRLIRWLRDVQRERSVLFHDAGGVSDLDEYRRAVPSSDLPRIFVLVDGYAAFNQLYEMSPDDLPEQFARLIGDSRSAGIHFVLANDLRSGVPLKVFGGISTRVVLRMASDEEYSSVGLPSDALPTDAPPGRGYLNNREIQVALVGSGETGEEQAAAIVSAAGLVGQPAAPAIARLDADVALGSIGGPGRSIVGTSGLTLHPVSLPLADQHTVVLGPVRSGRTTALLTMVLGADPRAWSRRAVLSPRATALTDEPGLWTDRAVGAAACRELALRLVQERVDGDDHSSMLVVVDDLFELAGDYELEEACDALLAAGREQPLRFLVGADLDAARRSGSAFFSALRAAKTGLLLQPESGDGDLLGAQFRVAGSTMFPVGRGFLVVRGAPELVQVARPRTTDAAPVGE